MNALLSICLVGMLSLPFAEAASAQNPLKKAGEAVKTTGEVTGDAAKKTAKATKKAGKKTGDATADAAKATGKATKKGAKATKDAVTPKKY